MIQVKYCYCTTKREYSYTQIYIHIILLFSNISMCFNYRCYPESIIVENNAGNPNKKRAKRVETEKKPINNKFKPTKTKGKYILRLQAEEQRR